MKNVSNIPEVRNWKAAFIFGIWGLRYKVRTKLMEHKGYIYIPDLAPAA